MLLRHGSGPCDSTCWCTPATPCLVWSYRPPAAVKCALPSDPLQTRCRSGRARAKQLAGMSAEEIETERLARLERNRCVSGVAVAVPVDFVEARNMNRFPRNSRMDRE